MQTISSRIQEIFDPEKILLQILDLIPDLIVAAISFLAFWLVWRATKSLLELALSRAGVDRTARTFLHSAYKYTVLAIGGVTALAQLGIDTTSVLTSLGVAGLTIGFAARDALSNVISGIFIFWDRPFVIGDLVEVDGHYGKVEDITMRSTRLVTPDGKMLAIPNSVIVNSTVASYTNFPHLRLDIPITIGVDEDVQKVRDLLVSIAASDREILQDPAPTVVIKALNDYNTEIELQAWIENEHGHIAERYQLRERMFEMLKDSGIDMPFETLKLEPVEVRSTDEP